MMEILSLREKLSLCLEILLSKSSLEENSIYLQGFKKGSERSLRCSAGREIGAYLVSTVKGQSVADWDGNVWKFRDSKMRGGILRIIEAV